MYLPVAMERRGPAEVGWAGLARGGRWDWADWLEGDILDLFAVRGLPAQGA